MYIIENTRDESLQNVQRWNYIRFEGTSRKVKIFQLWNTVFKRSNIKYTILHQLLNETNFIKIGDGYEGYLPKTKWVICVLKNTEELRDKKNTQHQRIVYCFHYFMRCLQILRLFNSFNLLRLVHIVRECVRIAAFLFSHLSVSFSLRISCNDCSS